MRKGFAIFVVALISIFVVGASNAPGYDCSSDCSTPPFITAGVKPNVLIILDNSNSMDEDFYGNAAGSFSSASKAYVAREALIQLIALLKDKLRLGVMTYTLPGSIASNYLHNSPYFASYEPKSYCPNPPPECQQYCKDNTGSTANAALSACETSCRAQPDASLFDATYMDEILTNYAVGSEQRNRYCDLVYPKTQRKTNLSDTSNYIYYKQALPFYASSGQGTDYCYSSAYNSNEGATYDTYKCYTQKTGTSDGSTGYGGSNATYTLNPTDSDFALGYYDFGRRLMWYQVGQTWFSNSSPGGGFIDDSPNVRVNDLVNSSGVTTSTYANLMTKLALKTETEYMSCTAANKNTGCDYIVNAGLTPTAGTLQSALDYFKGANSPINLRCQKNFIVYVTDGLPSVDESGTAKTAAQLMPTVKTKLQALRNITKSLSGTNYTFDVKTYVLGLGLTDQAKAKLDEMATEGGTAVNGHAYYVDNATEMVNTLGAILGDILKRVASGTSISILSEKAQKGANIMQAVFYPSKLFGLEDILWTGFLYDYWFYVSKTKSNIREDTNHDLILNLQQDRAMEFNFTEAEGLQIALRNDSNADGDLENDGANTSATVTLDGVTPIWEAGYQLFLKDPGARNIYTVGSSNTLVPFSTPSAYNPANLGSTFDACLTGSTASASYNNVISYMYGNDLTGCRDRTVTIGSNVNKTWKLGDIIYSTPRVVSDYHFCKDAVGDFTSTHCATNADCSAIGGTCAKKESAVFVGANDGMLHAFKTGILSPMSSSPQVARLDNFGAGELGDELWAFIPKNALPYLRCLASNSYCHQYTVDLSPYIVDMGDKKVLIGGMRLGGGACTASSNKYCFDPATKTFQSPLNSCNGDNQCGTNPYRQCIEKYTCTAPDDTCPSLSAACDPDSPYTCYSDNCVGLSSYFALDVTNPEAPVFLWEFAHPRLGYSYSGPAVIERGGNHYVMFASGPTTRTGTSTQSLRTFTLRLNSNLTVNSVYEYDFGNSAANSFGGRLYTTGLDMNADGNTDFVFLGFTKVSSVGNYSGGIIKLWTGNTDPALWDYNTSYLNLAQKPITAKVEFAKCFNRWYVYATSGRYFSSGETYTPQYDFIMGAPILCDENNACDQPNINFGHGNDKNFCSDLADKNKADAWYWDLNGPEAGYLKERGITDPTVTSYNAVFFTTTEPTADLCGFGGRTRVWGLNCAMGLAISDTSCAGYSAQQNTGTLYLQTSTGEITALSSAESFSLNNNRCSEWMAGVPPENSPPFVPPYQPLDGRILHWRER